MSSWTAHALLYRPGIRPVAQHFQIVIRLNDQHIASSQIIFHIRQEPPEIGGDGELDAFRQKSETDWIDGIVRNGKWRDRNVPDAKAVPGREKFQALKLRTLPGSILHRSSPGLMRGPSHKHRDAQLLG